MKFSNITFIGLVMFAGSLKSFAEDRSNTDCSISVSSAAFAIHTRSNDYLRDPEGHAIFMSEVVLADGLLQEGWKVGLIYKTPTSPEWKTVYSDKCWIYGPNEYPRHSMGACVFNFSKDTPMNPATESFEFIPFMERNALRVFDHNMYEDRNYIIEGKGRVENYRCIPQ